MFKAIFTAVLLGLVTPVYGTEVIRLHDENASTISMQGVGTVNAEPDEGYITLGVTSEDTASSEAVRKNTDSMVRLFGVLRSEGIEAKNIKTIEMSVQQKYKLVKEGDQSKQVADGFVASNMVRVTVCKLDRFGAVLDLAMKAGANSIHSISFGSSKSKELLAEARAKAVQDAVAKVDVICKELNVKLGKVRSVSEGGHYMPRAPQYRAMTMETAQDVPVSGGSLDFSVSVNVVWQLEQ